MPNSVAGRWLIAIVLREPESPENIELRIGDPSVEREQAELAGMLFAALVPRLFSPGREVREISDFVTDMTSRLSAANSVGKLEAEALIRSALGETTVTVDDIPAGMALRIHGYVSFLAVSRLGLPRGQALDLIVEAEESLRAASEVNARHAR